MSTPYIQNQLFNEVLIINLPEEHEKAKRMMARNVTWFDQSPDIKISIIPGVKFSDAGSDIHGRIDLNFKDPRTNRNITEGEVGCALAHIKAWEYVVEANHACLILEDDVVAVNSTNDPTRILKMISTDGMLDRDWDLFYLGRQPFFPDEEFDISEDVCVPKFSWLAHAYILTPHGAKKLLATHYKDSLFPVDEYLPLMATGEWPGNRLKAIQNEFSGYPKLVALALKNDLFSQDQTNRSKSSTTENSPEIYAHGCNPYNRNYCLLTVASDENNPGFKVMAQSAKDLGWIFSQNCFSQNEEWEGGTMESLGGGHKLHAVLRTLRGIEDKEAICLFLDGYDTLLLDSPIILVRNWLENFNDERICFAGEKFDWPPKEKNKISESTIPEYLNSGCYIGKIKNIEALLDLAVNKLDLKKGEDDQGMMHLIHEEIMPESIDIDVDCILFQCLSKYQDANGVLEFKNNRIYNSESDSWPSVIHGNGGIQSKKLFNKIADMVQNPLWVGPKSLTD